MKYPRNLQKNETIGFVAPSFGAATEPYRSAFLNAEKTFRKMGYSLEEGPNVFSGSGIGISSTPEKCGAELNAMYLSKTNQALISVGGGELMIEDLPYVDFGAMKNAEPKWYMGYSDNTNMTFLLPTLCDTAAIYAPCASDFGMEPWHRAVSDAFSLLTGECMTVESYGLWESESLRDESSPYAPYNVTEKNVPVFRNYDGEPFSGRFLGGCLDCLANLCGTRFDKVKDFAERYADDGIIWFLESCDLNVFSIRRALFELREAGWFANAKAFLIGRPGVMGQELMGLDQYEAVTGVLGALGKPILMDLDIGHLPPMMPLISGGYGTVFRTENGIRIVFERK